MVESFEQGQDIKGEISLVDLVFIVKTIGTARLSDTPVGFRQSGVWQDAASVCQDTWNSLILYPMMQGWHFASIKTTPRHLGKQMITRDQDVVANELRVSTRERKETSKRDRNLSGPANLQRRQW